MEFEVLDLGLTRYAEAHAKQLELLKARIAGEINDTLILTQHQKVFTLGKTGHISNILVPQEKLKKENIEVVNVERGGDITYHGPGQLVAYPIFFLPKGRRDLKSFLRLLEQSVIETAKTYQAKTCVIDGLTGVWESKTGEEHLMVWRGERKLTSMGLAFKNWVSFHGLALNVEADLTPFSYMNLCGLVGKKPVNFRDLTNDTFTFNDVKNTLVEEIRKQVKDW